MRRAINTTDNTAASAAADNTAAAADNAAAKEEAKNDVNADEEEEKDEETRGVMPAARVDVSCGTLMGALTPGGRRGDEQAWGHSGQFAPVQKQKQKQKPRPAAFTRLFQRRLSLPLYYRRAQERKRRAS